MSTIAAEILAFFVVDKYEVGSSAVDQRDCLYFIYAADYKTRHTLLCIESHFKSLFLSTRVCDLGQS